MDQFLGGETNFQASVTQAELSQQLIIHISCISVLLYPGVWWH
jgi:hypothetical protein